MLKIDKKYAKKYVGDKTLKVEFITPLKTLRTYIFNEVEGISTVMIVTTPTAEEYYETNIENLVNKYQKEWLIKSELFKDGRNTIRIKYLDDNKYRKQRNYNEEIYV